MLLRCYEVLLRAYEVLLRCYNVLLRRYEVLLRGYKVLLREYDMQYTYKFIYVKPGRVSKLSSYLSFLALESFHFSLPLSLFFPIFHKQI